MPITVGHSKSITVADGTNTGIVRPSDWNSNHAVTLNISGTDIFGAFSNAGNVTFGTDTAGYITATAPAGGGGGGAAISAGTQSQNTGTIIFSNSNGLTFGLNAGTLTGSHNGYTGATTQFLTTAQPVGAYLTTARASNDAVGLNTALTAGPLAWTVNSSGLSLNAGSVAGTTTGFGGNLISGSMTNNTAGLNLSLNHPAWLTTAANSTHSHGNPTLNLTNLAGTTASASNGFTLSLSATAQSNQTMGLYGVSNTTGASSSSTFDARSVSFQGAGIASVGFSGGSVVVSVPSGGGAGDGYNSAQFTNSTANSTMPIVWAGNSGGSGNITMGLTGSTVTASAPSGGGGGTLSVGVYNNTTVLGGNTTVSIDPGIVFYGAGGISVGVGSVGTGASPAGIIISGPSGAGGAPDRYYIEVVQGERLTTVRNLSETAFSRRPAFQPFWVDGTGIVPRTARMIISGAGSSNRSLVVTLSMGLYSLNNSTRMTLLTSDSIGVSITDSASSTVWNGPRMFDFTRMSGYTLTAEGRYALGLIVSATSHNATYCNIPVYGCDNMPAMSGFVVDGGTSATNNASQIFPFWGLYSTTTNALPGTVAQSQIYGGNSASCLDYYAVIKGI